MAVLNVDLNKTLGRIKPMHAVNNGPSCALEGHVGGCGDCKTKNGNLEEFKAAGIHFARTHDSSFYPRYGLEHTVDVHMIFPNFDADPYDPASYDFTCTDHYMKMIEAGGAKIFYRLGSRIEHEIKKYGTLVPKDFHKWAVICEHIIRHLTEGWANGMTKDIEYWEIWNEPDLDADDSANKRTWGGTKQEFFEFYHVAATHLKKCFPHLKIGGPAIAGNMDWAEDFLKQLKAPLDFFSWHRYAHDINKIVERANIVRGLLDKYGFCETESILNEWNYVYSWKSEGLDYSHVNQRKIKGASFNLAAMCASQKSPVDMLMYYDARPSLWCGLFDFVQIGKVTTKSYFVFPMFNELYSLGNEALSASDDPDAYVLAARNEDSAAVVFTRFNDDDSAESGTVRLDINGLFGETELEIYMHDGERDLWLDEKIVCFGDRFIFERTLDKFTCCLVKLRRVRQ